MGFLVKKLPNLTNLNEIYQEVVIKIYFKIEYILGLLIKYYENVRVFKSTLIFNSF